MFAVFLGQCKENEARRVTKVYGFMLNVTEQCCISPASSKEAFLPSGILLCVFLRHENDAPGLTPLAKLRIALNRALPIRVSANINH